MLWTVCFGPLFSFVYLLKWYPSSGGVPSFFDLLDDNRTSAWGPVLAFSHIMLDTYCNLDFCGLFLSSPLLPPSSIFFFSFSTLRCRVRLVPWMFCRPLCRNVFLSYGDCRHHMSCFFNCVFLLFWSSFPISIFFLRVLLDSYTFGNILTFDRVPRSIFFLPLVFCLHPVRLRSGLFWFLNCGLLLSHWVSFLKRSVFSGVLPPGGLLPSCFFFLFFLLWVVVLSYFGPIVLVLWVVFPSCWLVGN